MCVMWLLVGFIINHVYSGWLMDVKMRNGTMSGIFSGYQLHRPKGSLMSILVLGLGNTIMTDDGFGVEVVTRLSSRYHFEDTMSLLDGGTLGLDLLPYLEEVESLLIIDALDMRNEPGKIFRLEGAEVPRAFASKLSVHQMGLQDLLAVAELQGTCPPQPGGLGSTAGVHRDGCGIVCNGGSSR